MPQRQNFGGFRVRQFSDEVTNPDGSFIKPKCDVDNRKRISEAVFLGPGFELLESRAEPEGHFCWFVFLVTVTVLIRVVCH
ncbi:hypothetical protein MSNKSG1_03595 [Marinobacter santoriniensis NKSG1]|uniref:Uncharacterized protein n=1 Tax=Marinobacter santoriniensis NKSG1 TaxID=1288826 RepID=M7CUR0_9GAMM|nr:hypothetical protein MSNKSG1_03595 [Marinobacter santoriniensis NKSG1]